MSEKSGSSIINTPKGGGAVSGMGETFSPDLFTGTGNFSIPLQVPPGRNGLQPSLTIGYSSGNGNGIFGLGWSLSLPGISLKLSKGVPYYDPSKDTYILSGAEDLIATEKLSNVITRFRPRTEGLFARIERHFDSTNDYWIVKSKDGLTSYYGTPNSRGSDPAVIADPENRRNVFNWKLSKTIDLFGNHIIYEYERDLENNSNRRYDQLYLKQIKYGDFGDPISPKYLVSIDFLYGERQDAFSTYKQGFEIRTTKRCEQVKINSHPHPDPDILIRTYYFNYLDEIVPTEDRLPLNRVSMLQSSSVEGHDGATSEYMPPLSFKYSEFKPNKKDFIKVKGKDLPPVSLANPQYEMLDLFGNGLEDILEINGRIRYWRNLGNGEFDIPKFMSEAPSNLSLANPNVQFIDANGDGRVDLMVNEPNQSGYFSSKPGAIWDQKSFQPYKQSPSFSFADPNVKLIDLNGDGITDAIRSGSSLECFFNDREEGWSDTKIIQRKAINKFPNINFNDPRIRWADMSGDGMQDILLVNKGNVEYWPNLGNGNFGQKIVMRNAPDLPLEYISQNLLIGDIDGDGCADIVYVDYNKIYLWVNQSGNGFSEPVIIQGTPAVSEPNAVRLTDLKGKGTMGILWTMNKIHSQKHHMYYLDLSQGNKAYILEEMNNNMGAVTKIAYKSSIEYYLEDEKKPETRWKTTLPFPVQVVDCVEVIDEISNGKLTTEYSYHHGYWDGGEREFRGFGRVDQRDTEDFYRFNENGLHADQVFELVDTINYSPPTETKNWFHLGPVGQEYGFWEELDLSNEYWQEDPIFFQRPTSVLDLLKSLPRRARRDAIRTMRGTPLRTELYALDNHPQFGDRPYSVSESLPGVRLEFNGNDSVYIHKKKQAQEQYIFFPLSLGSKSSQWERGSDPMTQCSFTDDFDEYGQARLQLAIAVPRNRDYRLANSLANEAYFATASRTEYINKDIQGGDYLCGRVARSMSYEVVNDGTTSLLSLKNQIVQASLPIAESNADYNILACTINYYDGTAFTGLPYGQIGNYGILVRSESLVITNGIISDAYGSLPMPLQDNPNWTSEYPNEYQNQTPNQGAYTYYDNATENHLSTGYYAQGSKIEFDFQTAAANPRGLVKRSRDVLDHESEIIYDDFDLLPIEAVQKQDSALGTDLTTFAEYDYRTFQASLITDPNGNRATFKLSPLGLILKSAVMGKVSENLGDDIDTAPGLSMEYDFFAFMNDGDPVWVKTTQRLHHTNDTDVPLPERNETIVKTDYSDGFGRLLQTRAQAEDVLFGNSLFGDSGLPEDQTAPNQPAVGVERLSTEPLNVIVSGWKIYNNKGAVVEQYEPFFAQGFDYQSPLEVATYIDNAQKNRMFYDPRGKALRTINPDDTEQLVVMGIPDDIINPPLLGFGGSGGTYTPTPWESYSYDANDNAGRTHNLESASYSSHWNTPSSVLLDGLGRTIKTIDRNGNTAADEVVMQYQFDIKGNLLQVTDPLGRVSFQHIYDLTNNALKTVHLDSGVKTTVIDALGRPIEAKDSKGAFVLNSFDELNRPINMWARDDDASGDPTLRQHIIYGDSIDGPSNATNTNHLGKPYKHYDEAGLTTFSAYDFKGNLLEKERQVIADSELQQTTKYMVDWETATNILDSKNYIIETSYDALNRIKQYIYPEDVENKRRVLLPFYNKAGALEKVKLLDNIGGTATNYIEHIAYNTKGQRIIVAHSNNIMTRYSYDKLNFSLSRQRSETYTKTAWTFTSNGNVKQDKTYIYDKAGNIININEASTGSGIGGNNGLLRQFDYDPLYRLLSATGRENAPTITPIWNDSYRSVDNTITTAYTRNYQYDKMGNILQLQHVGNNNFTRNFNYNSGHNMLQSIDIGATNYAYNYDANGNQLSQTSSRKMTWDYADRLSSFYVEASGSVSQYTHYLYDAGGNRVKKLSRKQNGNYTSSTYIDSVFEFFTDGTDEQNTLHIIDDKSKIASIRLGNDFGESTPTIKYNLENTVGSSSLQLAADGANINIEEYYPFGETSFGSYSKKRYKYNGKERDEESGLYYYGARYYSAWTCKFISVDPLAPKFKHITPYQYADNDPINQMDIDGLQGPKTKENSGNESDSKNETEKDASYSELKLEADNTKVFVLKNSTMTPFVNETGSITETAKSKDTEDATEFSVNAQFKGFLYNEGLTYANGEEIGDGKPQKTWWYISSDNKGNYTFGQGPPPEDSENAVGGGRPLIIDKLPYGDKNIYKKGTPSMISINVDGTVEDKNYKYLTQRNAIYFESQDLKNLGKTIIAYNSATKELMLIVQENDTKGYSLKSLRNFLVAKGFDYALSFDGSDSTFLIQDKTELVENAKGGYFSKDSKINSGITFTIR